MRLYTRGVSPSVWYIYVSHTIFIIKIHSSDPLCLPNPSLSPIKAHTPGCPPLCFPRGTLTYLAWYLSIYLYISSFIKKSIFLFIITNVHISCKVFYSYPLLLSKPNLKRYDSQLQCGLLHFRIRSSALQKVCLSTAAKGPSWWSSG